VANSGQNPEFDFLKECWKDDPAKADFDQEVAEEVSMLGNYLRGWGASACPTLLGIGY
jgi:hypothetical protein